MKTDLMSIKQDLRAAFLDALIQGTKEPLKEYKRQINQTLNRLNNVGRIDQSKLDKAIKDPSSAKKEAADILNEARVNDGLRANPPDNPQYKETVENLRKAKKLTRQLNVSYRPYDVKANLSFVAQGSFIGGCLLSTLPLIRNISTSFNEASITPYALLFSAGSVIGAVRLATFSKSDFLSKELEATKLINKTLKKKNNKSLIGMILDLK